MSFDCLSQVAAAVGLRAKKKIFKRFVVDSRSVGKGDIFFALEGKKFDGHNFLREAASKGAVAAFVSESFQKKIEGLSLLRVGNVLKALQLLAQNLQRSRHQKIVAVTGSVGKTTSKEFIATLLAERYAVTKTYGNHNSQVGLPLFILNNQEKGDFFVVEMGISEPETLKNLVQIAPPEIAVVTKIGYAHVEFFPDGIEAIAAEKAKILSHPFLKWGVVHHQAMHFKALKTLQSCPIKTFGLYPDRGDYIFGKEGRIKEYDNDAPPIYPPFSETQFCECFIAAVAVARIVGLSWEEIAIGSKKLRPPQLRFERIRRGGITFINDCYSANPESMTAALHNLPFSIPKKGKTIAVLGEMLELGSYSQEAHSKIGVLATAVVDCLLCYGEGSLPLLEAFSQSGKPCEKFKSLEQLKARLFEITEPDDVVLIKGSNTNQLWKILSD